jgi:hypothetical protein
MPTYRILRKLYDYHPKGRRERERSNIEEMEGSIRITGESELMTTTMFVLKSKEELSIV